MAAPLGAVVILHRNDKFASRIVAVIRNRSATSINPLIDEQPLLSTRPATASQARLVGIFALSFFVAFLASLPFSKAQWPRIDSFITIVDTILLVGDLLTATLLFAQASVLRSRALLALGTGYLFTGLIIIPHALTFPGAFSPTGLLGAGVNTSIWIIAFWHFGLPIAVLEYTRLKRRDHESPAAPGSMQGAILWRISGAVAAVILLTLLATAGDEPLVALMTDDIHWLPSRVSVLAISVIALLAWAMLRVWRQPRRSILDLWLLLALWAWMIEVLLIMVTDSRFSGGWYLGRAAGMLSSVLVLLMLLTETSRLYARLALSLTELQRDRESRRLTMNAVAASIAHEIRQPLASIVATADAGSMLLGREPPATGEIPEILDAISEQGIRASQIIDSIRAMFGHRAAEKKALDVNELLRETAQMLSRELNATSTAAEFRLAGDLCAVSADRQQLQLVFQNLFVNALEAMVAVQDRPRTLTVRTSAPQADTVLISVQDTGVGLDSNKTARIFDTFFTTKPQGTGMGLPLCRAVVEAHGGRMWAEPASPVGATFLVQLPSFR